MSPFEWWESLSLLIGLAIGLMFLGAPVAFAFFGANLVGAWIFFGGQPGLIQTGRNVWDAVGTFALAPVALFLLMGEVMFHTGLATRAIDAIDRLFLRVPGRLALVAVTAGTTFSALSGSTMANTAILGSTLMPEMGRRGYHWSMTMGPILGTGGIAMLIPPSGLAIILGSLSGISIAGLLLAGIVPGVLMAITHFSYVMIRCRLNPALAPSYDVPDMTAWERWRPFLVDVVPLMSLFILVVGSILAGYATPSESAALGAVGAVALAAAYGVLSFANLHRSLVEAGRIAVMLLFILGASLTFSQVLAFSGATQGLLMQMTLLDPSPTVLLAAMLGIVLLLGCFMDPLSIMLICLPFFVPLAQTAGFELVWFGVLILLALEIGQTTPPFGVLLFVMKAVAPRGTTMKMVYASVLPFIALEALLLLALAAFPEIVSWLPELLRR